MDISRAIFTSTVEGIGTVIKHLQRKTGAIQYTVSAAMCELKPNIYVYIFLNLSVRKRQRGLCTIVHI